MATTRRTRVNVKHKTYALIDALCALTYLKIQTHEAAVEAKNKEDKEKPPFSRRLKHDALITPKAVNIFKMGLSNTSKHVFGGRFIPKKNLDKMKTIADAVEALWTHSKKA